MQLIITGGQNARHRPAGVLKVEAGIFENGGDDVVHKDDSVEATGTGLKWGSNAEKPKAVVSGRDRGPVFGI